MVRYCKRCGKSAEFASSGCFRVNAQQKSLDVWLIYKCAVCGTTWKLAVLSRVAPKSIPAEMLGGFCANDAELTMRYATDTALIRQNGAVPGNPHIEVIGEDANRTVSIRIHLVSQMPLDIKAKTVLREKLGLSGSEFAGLLESERLVSISGHDLKRCKLAGEIIAELRPNCCGE